MSVLKNIETEVGKALTGVVHFFSSGKAQAAVQEAGALVSLALPIVQEIDGLVPNKTVEQITAAYQKYGVPFVDGMASNPSGALLNLGTAVLQKNLPADKAGAATNILNTAVQLAVTAIRAQK